MAGANLEAIALNFYDRNCAGCQQRLPVRFPNLSQLVTDRDRARELDKQAEAREAASEAAALQTRAAERGKRAEGSDSPTAGIFDVIDQFDREPSNENGNILLETATAVPRHFNSAVQETLFDLIDAGWTRSKVALEVLNVVGAEASRLCQAALLVLANGTSVRVAGAIVAKHLDTRHETAVPNALPALVELAAQTHGFGPLPGSSGDPEPLLSAYRLFPDLVLSTIQLLLRQTSKHPRIAACNSVSIIVGIDPDFGPKAIRGLMESLNLPDDWYDEGPAKSRVARAVADIMLNHPHETEKVIRENFDTAPEELQSALFEVYESVLRSETAELAEISVKPAHELAFRRFVEVLTHRRSDQLMTQAIDFLRNRAGYFPSLVDQHAETLLGATALIASDLDSPESPLLKLEITPDPLRAFEEQARLQSLAFALDAIATVVSAAAIRKPQSIGTLVVRTFESLDDSHDQLKAALVKCLGRMATDADVMPLALPSLYQAMTSQSVRVRGTAAEAYAMLGRRSADDLPSLVHDTFMLLLADPYVFVQSKAVDALNGVSLPGAYIPRTVNLLWTLIVWHSQSRSNDELLLRCIQRFLALWNGEETLRPRIQFTDTDDISGLGIRLSGVPPRSRAATRAGRTAAGTPWQRASSGVACRHAHSPSSETSLVRRRRRAVGGC